MRLQSNRGLQILLCRPHWQDARQASLSPVTLAVAQLLRRPLPVVAHRRRAARVRAEIVPLFPGFRRLDQPRPAGREFVQPLKRERHRCRVKRTITNAKKCQIDLRAAMVGYIDPDQKWAVARLDRLLKTRCAESSISPSCRSYWVRRATNLASARLSQKNDRSELMGVLTQLAAPWLQLHQSCSPRYCVSNVGLL